MKCHLQAESDCDLPPATIDFHPQFFLLRRGEGLDHFVGQFAVNLLGLVEVFRFDILQYLVNLIEARSAAPFQFWLRKFAVRQWVLQQPTTHPTPLHPLLDNYGLVEHTLQAMFLLAMRSELIKQWDRDLANSQDAQRLKEITEDIQLTAIAHNRLWLAVFRLKIFQIFSIVSRIVIGGDAALKVPTSSSKAARN
jgi:hypothetical protein